MENKLNYQIYREDGELMGATKHGEDAACLVAFVGDGAYVKVNGKIVWSEGKEEFPASDSWDGCADIMASRYLGL